jgi:hypothetical protein
VPHGFCAQRPCFRAGQRLKFNPFFACFAKIEAGKTASGLKRRGEKTFI